MDEVTSELVSKSPQMLMEAGDKWKARHEALHQAICDVMASNLSSECIDRLKTVVDVTHENMF